MKKKILSLVSLGTLLVMGFIPAVYPQEKGYPNRAITILTPHAPGTGVHTLISMNVERLKKEYKVPVDIIVKTGAAGAIAAEEVVRAKNDGYTFFGGYMSSIGTMTRVNPDGTVNLFRDFVPIAAFLNPSLDVLCARSDSEFKLFQNVVDYDRRNPNKLVWGTSMVGGDPYLIALMVKRQAKLNVIHLSFSTMPENVAALLGGHTHLGQLSLATAGAHLAAGKLRAIAITYKSKQPLPNLPDAPTWADLGYPQVSIPVIAGILAPKGVAPAVIETWEKTLKANAKDAEFISSCNKAGAQLDLRTGTEEVTALLKELVGKYSQFTPEELGWATKK